jgi:hypothetical protein
MYAMSIELPESDIILPRLREKTEKLHRTTVSADEKTIPDAVSERALTTAEVIRSMTATFQHKRS